MPETDLKVLQFGKESAWGTAVAATAKMEALTDATLNIVDEQRAEPILGTLAPGKVTAEVYQYGTASLEMEGTYEDILHPLESLFGEESATGTGPWVWTYAAPDGTAPTPRPLTAEFGASGASYKMAGAVFTGISIAIEAGGVWTISGDMIGKAVSVVTLASPSGRAVELIRGADTQLFVDVWAGTMGSTEVTATLISAELSIETPRHLKNFCGTLGPDDKGEARWTGTLALTLEYNASAKAYVDALIAPALVQRQIEIKATSGTSIAQIQFAGTLQDGAELFEDTDGNISVSLTWRGTYNTTFSNWLTFIITNDVETLP